MADIIPYTERMPLLMKSGVVHWLDKELGERLQKQLETQTAHSFVKLRALNITINTAEVEGVYTMDQYESIEKARQGMWQCSYGQWHNKGKRECECRREYFNQQREKNRTQDLHWTPPTPEEKQRAGKQMASIREHLEKKGIFRPQQVKHDQENGRTCIMCPTKLKGAILHYCSGQCIEKAKVQGIYGRENESEAEKAERLERLSALA